MKERIIEIFLSQIAKNNNLINKYLFYEKKEYRVTENKKGETSEEHIAKKMSFANSIALIITQNNV